MDIHPIRQPVHHKLKKKSLGIFFWSQFVSNVRPLTWKNKTFNSGFQNKECYFYFLFQQHIRVKKKHQNTDNELKKQNFYFCVSLVYFAISRFVFHHKNIPPKNTNVMFWLCSDLTFNLDVCFKMANFYNDRNYMEADSNF